MTFSASIHKGCCFKSNLPHRFRYANKIQYARWIRICFSIKRFLGMVGCSLCNVQLKAQQHFKPAKYQIFGFDKSFRKDFQGIIFANIAQHRKRKYMNRIHLTQGMIYILLKDWGSREREEKFNESVIQRYTML